MISAEELNKKYENERKNHKISGKTLQELYELQDSMIENAAKKGMNHCVFYPHDTVWDCWVPEMKEHYKKLGYNFQPTGYIGGVLQDTLEICW